jgi:hypothetical protein
LGEDPLWGGLLGQLQEACGVRAEDVATTDPLEIAQAARDKNEAAYYRQLDKIFGRKDAPKSARRYHLLARIDFISYLTLNFDPVLIDTLDLHSNITVSEYPNLQAQFHNNREVFCLHGRLSPDRPAAQTRIVLTRRDFEEAYDPWGASLHSFLHQTFTGNDVCFIGCNPSEPNLSEILKFCARQCEAQHGWSSPTRPHWYLLADDGYENLESLSGCGIEVVRYPKVDSSFSGLDVVLEYWARKRPPTTRPAGVQEPTFSTDVEPDR